MNLGYPGYPFGIGEKAAIKPCHGNYVETPWKVKKYYILIQHAVEKYTLTTTNNTKAGGINTTRPSCHSTFSAPVQPMLLLATKAHISAAVLGHVIASLQKLGFWICWCMFDAVLCQNTDHGTVRLTLLTFQEADLDQGQRRRPETSGSAMATMTLVLSSL